MFVRRGDLQENKKDTDRRGRKQCEHLASQTASPSLPISLQQPSSVRSPIQYLDPFRAMRGTQLELVWWWHPLGERIESFYAGDWQQATSTMSHSVSPPQLVESAWLLGSFLRCFQFRPALKRTTFGTISFVSPPPSSTPSDISLASLLLPLFSFTFCIFPPSSLCTLRASS